MSAEQERPNPADESESDVFDIVLPITIFVLSDDDFLQDEAEEQAPLVPELKEVKQAPDVNSSVLDSSMRPSDSSSSLTTGEENKFAANKDDSVIYCEEKQIRENVCDNSKLSLSDWCDASKDTRSQNDMLPVLPCETEPAEISETSDRKECDDSDRFQKIPLFFAADGEGRGETTDRGGQLTLTAVCKDEEECVNATGVSSDGSQGKQPEIHKEMGTIVEVKDIDSSENGSNGTNNETRKGSRPGDGTLSSVLDHSLKEEAEPIDSHSDLFIDRCSPTSAELVKDVGNLEMNVSVQSSTTEEHTCKSLMPIAKKRHQQQYIVSPHKSPSEIQSQQEDSAWQNNSVNIKPFSKASCSTKKHENLNLKCRFCSSVYKRSALLKRHVYTAHKDKKIHKCCFCKRTFFFSVNLKNHLKFHKKMTRLHTARKNRLNARRIRQRRTEESKSETKKKESKYKKYFIKIEKDFTSLGVPVIFSCKLCFFGSSDPRSFIHHMKGHKERPPYQCPQCDYSCVSLSYMLNHMYWHAGYKLYKCRFCAFFSLYFASMVRHSYTHIGTKPYSCELCQSAFSSTSELNKHRQLHVGEEMCQGLQLDFVSGRKRTRRPSKSYMCDECNVLFYTKGHLSLHKKFHEQLKVTATGYTNQSNRHPKSKEHGIDSDSQGCVSLSDEDDSFTGGMCNMLASEVDFKQAGDVQHSKKMCLGRAFKENSHGSNTSAIFGSRSEVLDPYKVGTAVYNEDPLFSPELSHSQIQGSDEDAAYHESKDMWSSSLSAFKMHKCQHCDYATAVHSNFNLHLKMHTEEEQLLCQECNKSFKNSKRFQRHKLLHVKDQYKCSRYLYADSRLGNLELHHEMQVGVCPERDFGSSGGLSGAYSMLGPEDYGEQTDTKRDKGDLLAQSQSRFYQCTECEYATYILSSLRLHIRTHTGEKPYSCSVCQKTFRTSSHLKRHEVLHLSTKHLKCRKCDYSTNKWLSLKQHLASHSVNESSSTVCLYDQKPLPVKTYTCEECGYITVHHGNFKQHLRIHTGEKPFKCRQCGGAFRTSSHLKRHMLTHLKLECRRCDFFAIDKRTFQRHVKMHKKKHKCSKCNVLLSTKKLLENHKQQCHF